MANYPGEMNDVNIRRIFCGAADLNIRELKCDGHRLHVYAIDGLTDSNPISEYIMKPIMQQLSGENMRELYEKALYGVVVNAVAKPCKNLDDVAHFLVNGFCVVLFEGAGVIAFVY